MTVGDTEVLSRTGAGPRGLFVGFELEIALMGLALVGFDRGGRKQAPASRCGGRGGTEAIGTGTYREDRRGLAPAVLLGWRCKAAPLGAPDSLPEMEVGSLISSASTLGDRGDRGDRGERGEMDSISFVRSMPILGAVSQEEADVTKKIQAKETGVTLANSIFEAKQGGGFLKLRKVREV